MWNHTFTIASLCVLCFLCKYVIISIWVYYTLTPFYFIHRGNGLMVSHTKIRQHILASSHDVLCHILQPVDKTDNSTTDYCLNSDASYMDGILLGFVIFTCSIYNTIGLLCLKRRTLVTISCMISTLMGFMLNTIKSHLLQLFVLVYFIVSITSCIPLLFAAITDTLPTHLRWVETSSICFGENFIICFPFFLQRSGHQPGNDVRTISGRYKQLYDWSLCLRTLFYNAEYLCNFNIAWVWNNSISHCYQLFNHVYRFSHCSKCYICNFYTSLGEDIEMCRNSM